MMKSFFGMALAAALVAVPVALEAQTPPAPQAQEQTARRMGPAPMERVLRLRAELGLTDAQVAQIQAIGQRLQEQNRPLVEQLRAAGVFPGAQLTPEQRERMRERMQNLTPEQREQMRQRMEERRRNLTPEQREQMRQRMEQRRAEGARPGPMGRQIPEELRPVVEQLRQNNRAAAEQVRSVLTPEQRTRLQELMQQRRGAVERSARPQGARGFRGGR
jgi:Spy/CpxP family protein refolding chaperone